MDSKPTKARRLWHILAVLQLGGLCARAQENYVVALNGNSQVPPSTLSSGTGSGSLVLNANQTLTYTISYTNVIGSFAVAHIHGPGGVGTNAPIMVGLNNVPTTATAGTLSGTTPALDATQLGYLRSGFLYVNVHTAPSYLSGEIRGQIVPAPVAPRLEITFTATNHVVISWPLSATGFLLQENSELNTTNWTTSSATIADDGTNRFAAIEPASGGRFYRLFKP